VNHLSRFEIVDPDIDRRRAEIDGRSDSATLYEGGRGIGASGNLIRRRKFRKAFSASSAGSAAQSAFFVKNRIADHIPYSPPSTRITWRVT
jgi:hypothetical protein